MRNSNNGKWLMEKSYWEMVNGKKRE